jgi:hypothetical protein
MKSRSVDYVTSNEELVRLRIFDGELPAHDAYRELWELEKAQHEATWRQYREYVSAAQAIIEQWKKEPA